MTQQQAAMSGVFQDPPSMDFKRQRRRLVDQIMRDTSLPIEARLVSYAIGTHLNRNDGATFTHSSTLACELGIKWKVAQDAVDLLRRGGYLDIVTRAGRDYIVAVWRNDAPLPLMPSGGREFTRQRGEWLDMIMFDTALSLKQRAVAYVAAHLIDPVTHECVGTCREIADLLGISPQTVLTAIKALRRAGWLECNRMSLAAEWHEPQDLSNRCPIAVQSVSNRHSDNVEKSTGCARNPVNPANLVNITSLRLVPRGGAVGVGSPSAGVRFADEPTLRLWQELFEFMTGAYGMTNNDGEHHQTMAGLLKISNDPDLSYMQAPSGLEARDVMRFVRAGLLSKRGKWFTITDDGVAAYEHGYVEDGEQTKKEAA
jgi:hypothetical protein